MPNKDKTESGSPTIPDELIDQLLGDYKKPEDLTGPNGLIKQLVAKLVTRAMNTELDHHLGYEPGQPVLFTAVTPATFWMYGMKLVDREAVRFLARCEAEGITLVRCPAYIRAWIGQEKVQP